MTHNRVRHLYGVLARVSHREQRVLILYPKTETERIAGQRRIIQNNFNETDISLLEQARSQRAA